MVHSELKHHDQVIKYYIDVKAIFKLAINENIKTDPAIIFRSKVMSQSRHGHIWTESHLRLSQRLKKFLKILRISNVKEAAGCLKKLLSAHDAVKGRRYIPTAKKLAKRKAVVNIRNKNFDESFAWSILAALHPVEENAE